jgi:hypothetical protein
MKPTPENLSKWIYDIKGYGSLQKVHNENDLEILDEAFKLFLGNYPIEKLQSQKTKDGFIADFKRHGYGYMYKENFYVYSIKEHLRDYGLWIWHDNTNTQIIVERPNDGYINHLFRFERDELYCAIYAFYKKEPKQLNIFDILVA